MKKISISQRYLDVVRSIKHRKPTRRSGISGKNIRSLNNKPDNFSYWRSVNGWIDNQGSQGLKVEICRKQIKKRKNVISIVLPEVMDFNDNYDKTIQVVTAIRKLVDLHQKKKNKEDMNISKKAYRLGMVVFDELRKISTSAALVLTAELSKWDESIRKKLVPDVDGWDGGILKHFYQLSFFDLFETPRDGFSVDFSKSGSSDVDYIPYTKVSPFEPKKASETKDEIKRKIQGLVGEEIETWALLHGGLSEAINNVTHHAYPENEKYHNPSWYLTGAYNKATKELKIVFYDQGIGIPNSLPASEIWENIVSYLSRYNLVSKKYEDKLLLKAAVMADRTRTNESDRGQGLQDLKEFINYQDEGYMSIISYHGLYKYSKKGSLSRDKSIGFERPLMGTLIIWSAILDGVGLHEY